MLGAVSSSQSYRLHRLAPARLPVTCHTPCSGNNHSGIRPASPFHRQNTNFLANFSVPRIGADILVFTFMPVHWRGQICLGTVLVR
jgi:hypothetical protein